MTAQHDMDLPAGTDPAVAAQLADAFHCSGYVRRQNPERVSEDGSGRYKKGDEIRLVVRDEAELERARALLVKAGFKPGKPYRQGGKWRQPVYGRKQVAQFLEMVEAVQPGI